MARKSAARGTADTSGSTVVKITDADGREHYTARGSQFHQSLGKDVAVEDVVDDSRTTVTDAPVNDAG